MIGAGIRPTTWGSGLRWVLLMLAALTAWRLWVSALLPVTRDEAYYFDWARHLAWGYFDHPPGVAVIGLGTLLQPGSALAARAGAVLLGGVALLVLWRLYRASGLTPGNGLLMAVLLGAASLPALTAGVITTPDTALLLCWPLALHEALRALQGQRRRWLSAGIATGLGLLGKYTMLVIGPIFLWALLRADPQALRTRWPYLGGLLALLIFAPNLVWNAQNDWLTLRFQFGHGFSTESGPIQLAADSLPAVTGVHAHRPEPPASMPMGERLSSLGTYLGEQLLIWGLLLLPIGLALWRARRYAAHRTCPNNRYDADAKPAPEASERGGAARHSAECPPTGGQAPAVAEGSPGTLDPAAVSLLGAAALMPLGLFAVIALGSDVEANWAALYLVGATPFVARLLRRWASRWALIAAAGNLLLVSLYTLHAAIDVPPLPDSARRILREAQGFEELAAYSSGLSLPVIADRYQFAAMLNFYQPQLKVSQWPGITRPSEYGRGHLAPLPDPQALQQTGFWLLARKFSPPQITGFRAVRTKTLFSCPDGRFTAIDGSPPLEAAGCGDPANIWRLYRYTAASSDPSAQGG